MSKKSVNEQFNEWFEEYCDQDCPTEGYEDAKRTAMAAWQYQQTLLDKKSNEFSTNIDLVEAKALVDFMHDNNVQLVNIQVSYTGIGSTKCVSLPRKPETAKNITNYEWW